MKKISTYFFIVLLSVVVFLLGFDHKVGKQPNTYYQVYLDNEFIGVIESKKELEDYINSQADTIRENVREYKLKLNAIDTYNKYEESAGNEYSYIDKVNYIVSNKNKYNLTDMDIENLNFYKNERLYLLNSYEIEEIRDYVNTNSIYEHVNDVYTPNGIEIKKVYTYNDSIVSVEDIYKDIIKKKSCTVSGYRFTIKGTDGKTNINIYTLDRKIFSDAIEDLITIFVDENKYQAYKNGTQSEITTTGSIIENIYVDEDITYKAVNIPIEEVIYTNSKDLSAYLLYGDKFTTKTVQVKIGDTIESISFDNKISVQEFLIFNPQYTNRDNLLVNGSDVVISKVDPKIQIVVETHEVVDKQTEFSTVEKYDANLTRGSVVVTQNGVKGLERITQNVKSVNGEITYVDPVDKEVLKTSIPKIVSIGTRYVPTIGSTSSWGLPVNPGYTFSSYYGYRLSVFGEGNFHSGLDFAGTGYGSPVYATNNGVIEILAKRYDYGNYIMINHNNGYYTLYAHMSGFAKGLSQGSTVTRGQVIGYVGSTGWATGPHLHYEVRTCAKYSCVTNPLNYYR